MSMVEREYLSAVFKAERDHALDMALSMRRFRGKAYRSDALLYEKVAEAWDKARVAVLEAPKVRE